MTEAICTTFRAILTSRSFYLSPALVDRDSSSGPEPRSPLSGPFVDYHKLIVPPSMKAAAERVLYTMEGGKMADWKYTYGSFDPAEPIDPLQDAINNAVRELK